MKVTKYSGELVHYDEQKLINSLRKSGADKAVAETIVKKIESELYEGIASKKNIQISVSITEKYIQCSRSSLQS